MNIRKTSYYSSSFMFFLFSLIFAGLLPQESHGWGYMQCKRECEPASQKCKTKAKADECARECPRDQFKIVEACRQAASASAGTTTEQEIQPLPPTKPEPSKPQVRPEFPKPTITRPQVLPEPTKPQVRPLPQPEVTKPQVRPLPQPEVTKPQVRPESPKPTITRPQVHPEPLKPQVRPEVVKPQPSPEEPDVTEMKPPSVALKPKVSGECISTTELKINDQYQQLKSKIDPRGLAASEGVAKKYQMIIPNKIHLDRNDTASLQKLSSFIDTIIEQEKRNCDDYLPFYHSGGAFLALLTDIQNFIDKVNRQKIYKAPSDSVGKGKSPRLIKGPFKTVVELKNEIEKLGTRVKIDHNDLISPHLVSASLSMLDTDPGESAVGYFFRRHNINLNTDRARMIVKNILNKAGIVDDRKLEKYYDVLNNYAQSVSGVIIQFFVKKDVIRDVVYLAQPFGLFINTSEGFRSLTETFIENYQNLSTTDFTKYMQSIKTPGAKMLDNLLNAGRLQARILIDSPLLNQKNLKFSIYYELKKNATHTIKELQQQLYEYLQKDLQATAPLRKSAVMPGVFNAENELIMN
ncbi:MAG TPA: hypothetical protein VNJ29_00500 [Candidatus Nitrosotenuis sp.]|nr:hypothetical protein [Candidatus Nitrosotenuis sp.]